MPDPTPEHSWLSRWLLRQSPVVQHLLTAVLGAVVATVLQWTDPVFRPPAPALVPAEQERLDIAVHRGEVLADVFGQTFPELSR